VVVEDVVDAAEVVTVAPVPLVVELDVLLLVVEVVELEGTSCPSQSFEIVNSAQFQNCSGTPRPSSGRGWVQVGKLPG
jgi:hypothetical protein